MVWRCGGGVKPGVDRVAVVLEVVEECGLGVGEWTPGPMAFMGQHAVYVNVTPVERVYQQYFVQTEHR